MAPSGIVKQVVVTSTLLPQRVVWTVKFYVETHVEPTAVDLQGAVAIDVGWRKLGSGLRVAYGHGHDGRDWPLVLPDAWIARMRYVDSVRSGRDEHFNFVLARLRDFRASVDGARPDWFSRQTESIHAWKKPGALVRLARTWEANRFAGDELFDTLEWWGAAARDAHWRPGVLGYLRHDRHLWAIEAGVRRKAYGERKHLYRCWANRLSQDYRTCVLESFDLRPVAERSHEPPAGQPVLVEDQAQSYRQLAAVSELREVLRQTFIREGGCGSARSEASHSTHECYACGQVDAFDAARELAHTCSRCGRIWDQDANAARVLLARERWCDARSTARARVKSKSCACHEKKENHFAKLKRLKAERLAREQAARNEPDTLTE